LGAPLIYHVCTAEAWEAAVDSGTYHGSADDARDGYLHFSSGDQVRESVAKHRAGQDGLVMLAVDPQLLGDALKWEVSRGGALFPHLYGRLPLEAVTQVTPLPLGDDGVHMFPPGTP
jgi:uncharacterized protein (DUF952 family)